MNKIPVVPQRSSGSINFTYTYEAERVRKDNKNKTWPHAQTHEQVLAQAQTSARDQGSKDPDMFTLRGMMQMQFGQFRGQTFHWMMENAIGYASFFLYQMAWEGGSTPDRPLGDNKRELKLYMKGFPAGRRAIQQKTDEEQAKRARLTATARLVSTDKPVQAIVKQLNKLSSPAKEPRPSTSALHSPTKEEDWQDDKFVDEVEKIEQSQKQQDPTSTPSRSLCELRAKPKLQGILPLPDEHPLPDGWKQTMPKEDHACVSKELFRTGKHGKAELKSATLKQLWYYPPQPTLIPSQVPNPDRYFAHPLLVWMPRRMWRVPLYCPECKVREVTSAGIHRVVRQVLDLTGYYNLVTETHECKSCDHRKFLAWSPPIVNQLDIGHRHQFPVLPTYQ